MNKNSCQIAEEHNQMGLTYVAIGEYEEAINEYEKAISIDDNCLDAHYNLAFILAKGFQPSRIDEAILELETIVEREPQFRMTCLLLADLYWQRRQLKEAEISYREALNIVHVPLWEYSTFYDFKDVPYHALVHQKLGHTLDQQRKLTEALKHYQKAIKFDPTYILPRYNLGLCYMDLNKAYMAIEEFREIIRIAPNFRNIHYLLGKAYWIDGQVMKAIYHLQQEVENDPYNINAQSMLSQIRNSFNPTLRF